MISGEMGMADESFSDGETERRANEALKRMLSTPPKPHKDSKLGKRKPSDDGR
jgi:hypothetical protein